MSNLKSVKCAAAENNHTPSKEGLLIWPHPANPCGKKSSLTSHVSLKNFGQSPNPLDFEWPYLGWVWIFFQTAQFFQVFQSFKIRNITTVSNCFEFLTSRVNDWLVCKFSGQVGQNFFSRYKDLQIKRSPNILLSKHRFSNLNYTFFRTCILLSIRFKIKLFIYSLSGYSLPLVSISQPPSYINILRFSY